MISSRSAHGGAANIAKLKAPHKGRLARVIACKMIVKAITENIRVVKF